MVVVELLAPRPEVAAPPRPAAVALMSRPQAAAEVAAAELPQPRALDHPCWASMPVSLRHLASAQVES